MPERDAVTTPLEPPEPPEPPLTIGGLRARGQGGAVRRAAAFLRRAQRMWRLYWLRAELRFIPSETQRLFALTMVIGVLCGFAAVAFHLSIRLAERLIINRAEAASGHSWLVWMI